MNKKKPTKEQINHFNDLCTTAGFMAKEILQQYKKLIKSAKEVDKVASMAYKYANGKNGMYYADVNGMLRCINKKTSEKVECMDYLRNFSLDFSYDGII